MRKYLILAAVAALALPQAAQADIVAGWDTWDDVAAPTVSVTAAGVTATAAATGDPWTNNDGSGRGSSNDTTWGTLADGTNPASAVTNVGEANFTLTNTKNGGITFTIMNGGTDDLNLDAFHFDALAFRPNAARTYTVSVLSGDITSGLVGASAGTPMNDNSTDDITHLGGGLTAGGDQHDDIDLDLTGLSDNVLEAGGTAVFQLDFSNGSGGGGGHHLFLDNVAISGNSVAVPEPSSLAILGLAGFGMLVRRRK